MSDFLDLKRIEFRNNSMGLSCQNLTDEDFSDMDSITRKKLMKVRSLGFNGNPKVNFAYAAEFFSNLEDLDLGHGQVKGLEEGLNKLPKLSSLSFSNFKIEKINFLDNLVNLKKLTFGVNSIFKIEGLDRLVNLEELDFSDNKITKIAGLDNLVNLEELSFSDNDITEISGLDNLTKLEKLFLSHNKIGRISGLDNLANLKVLLVDYNKITEISGLDNLVNLEHIDLRYNLLTEIKGLGNLGNLEWLYLSGQEKNAPRVEVQKLGGLSSVGYALEPQNFVAYSRNEK